MSLNSFEKGVAALRVQLKTIPTNPGVYRMITKDGAVMYVGKAKNLKNRVTSYTQAARLPERLQRMVSQIDTVEILITRTESEALLLEANLIQKLKPPFNILLRDDKSFPYILITHDHEFPLLTKHRGAKNKKGNYFGPFASGSAVNETIEHLQRAFKLRNCSNSSMTNRSRPCLQYHIKRCTAPCVGKVTAKDYTMQVQQACNFLRGKGQELQSELVRDMNQASDDLEFERAAALRDRILVLTKIQSRQDIDVPGLGDADVFAIHQHDGKSAVQLFFFRADRHYGAHVYFPSHDNRQAAGAILSAFIAQFYAQHEPPRQILLSDKPDQLSLLQEALSEKAGRKIKITVPQKEGKKRIVIRALANAAQALARKMAAKKEQKKLMIGVANVFGLKRVLKRIEVYDNSHLSGTYAVGAMIAAGEDGFLKKTYRKFTIKTAKSNDDFAMMNEVLERRFKRLIKEDPKRQSDMWPDLLLIDGGAGQIGKVKAVLEKLGIRHVALVGIAKGPDRNAGRERFFVEGKKAFSLPIDDPILYYLQRLRDESHRFAIGTHRAKRSKALIHSPLEDISGIGASRKKALLQAFGSGKAVAESSIEDLARIPNISQNLAKKIYDYFHEDV